MGAAAILSLRPAAAPISGLLILAWWFCDRADGQLARLQGTVSAWGAWLDANADELVDLAIHVALASAAAASATSSGQRVSPVAWGLLLAFLAGKYLFMHGLWTQEHSAGASRVPAPSQRPSSRIGRLRALYHLPGNADVRAHLLAAALLTGCLTAELAGVALYYNLRWIARYILVARRQGGSP
jgi:phosphatidylglycerophosphate synthase